MSVRAAVWCLWLAALAPLCAALSAQPHYVSNLITWPECQATNPHRTVPRRTRDLDARSLFLHNCNITNLDPGSFSNLPNLTNIQLQFNNIKRLDVTLFVPVNKLRVLYLHKNPLLGRELPLRLFNNNRDITRLDFSHNDMNDTPFDLLQGLGELQFLNLNWCSLRRVPFLVTQPVLKSLEVLLLSFNNIYRISDPDMFSRLKNLRDLWFSYNLIEHIHEDTFKPLTKLSQVHLDNNRLKYIPEKLFHNHQFVIINLSGNLIEYLPANAFFNTGFAQLNLSGNRLTYLPDTIYPAFVKWSTLFSSERLVSKFIPNPWQCACLNEILVQLKRRNISYDSTGLDGKHPVCELTDGPCIKNTRIALPYS